MENELDKAKDKYSKKDFIQLVIATVALLGLLVFSFYMKVYWVSVFVAFNIGVYVTRTADAYHDL